MMAEAHGKLTGRPGIAFVTRGPGATNASPGLHIARQDSTPMILFVGQIERGHARARGLPGARLPGRVRRHRQVGDARSTTPARIPELISRAFHVATSGPPRPGRDRAAGGHAASRRDASPDAPRLEPVETHPAPRPDGRAAEAASTARAAVRHPGRQPLVGAGRATASRASPSASTCRSRARFRRQMLFPADHPCYAGDLGLGANPKLLARIKAPTCVLLVGGRLSEMPTPEPTRCSTSRCPSQTLVHVHAGRRRARPRLSPDPAINASPQAFAAALEACSRRRHRAGATDTREAPRRATSPGATRRASAHPGELQMGEVMALLRERLPADTIFCNGAGNFATWVHRFWPFRRFGTQLAPTSGSMGYGVPAAVGAKRVQPDRTVVVLRGRRRLPDERPGIRDGRAIRSADPRRPPRQRHVRHDPHAPGAAIIRAGSRPPPSRTPTSPPTPGPSAATASASSATEDFAPALERALASGKPAILHCLIDPEAITPSMSLSQIRASALARKS